MFVVVWKVMYALGRATGLLRVLERVVIDGRYSSSSFISIYSVWTDVRKGVLLMEGGSDRERARV